MGWADSGNTRAFAAVHSKRSPQLGGYPMGPQVRSYTVIFTEPQWLMSMADTRRRGPVVLSGG